MQISRSALNEAALKFIKPHKDYDRIDVAHDAAAMLADNIYMEFGGSKGMSLRVKGMLKEALYEIALENIDWVACNRKRDPEEYADMAWRMNDPEEMLR